MQFLRSISLVVLVVAVLSYGLDCVGMTTPEQAMQCCNSMRCPVHQHRGQDCCNTMPETHAVLAQPLSVPGIISSPVMLGFVQTADTSIEIETIARVIAEHSHAPPLFYSPATLPLRI